MQIRRGQIRPGQIRLGRSMLGSSSRPQPSFTSSLNRLRYAWFSVWPVLLPMSVRARAPSPYDPRASVRELAADGYIGQALDIVARVEVAVIGAGIVGLAVARELTARGAGVAVL